MSSRKASPATNPNSFSLPNLPADPQFAFDPSDSPQVRRTKRELQAEQAAALKAAPDPCDFDETHGYGCKTCHRPLVQCNADSKQARIFQARKERLEELLALRKRGALPEADLEELEELEEEAAEAT